MNSFFLKVDGKYKKILFGEILYVEAYNNYVRIHTLKKHFLAHYSLKQLEEHMPSSQFYRIHKSYIVAVDKITEFDCESVYIDTVQLPLSTQYIETLKSKLNIICSEKKRKPAIHMNGSIIKSTKN
jgi:DNA-binding LytR/AlgR family response regulator